MPRRSTPKQQPMVTMGEIQGAQEHRARLYRKAGLDPLCARELAILGDRANLCHDCLLLPPELPVSDRAEARSSS